MKNNGELISEEKGIKKQKTEACNETARKTGTKTKAVCHRILRKVRIYNGAAQERQGYVSQMQGMRAPDKKRCQRSEDNRRKKEAKRRSCNRKGCNTATSNG